MSPSGEDVRRRPLVAWRSWLVEIVAGEPRLRSVVRPTVWEPGNPLEAACAMSGGSAAIGRHDPPGAACTCGVHAAFTPEHAAGYLAAPSRRSGIAAIGQVVLWGTVHQGERGLRAALAYPAAVRLVTWRDDRHVAGDLGWIAWSLEADYGVDVETLRARGPHLPQPGITKTTRFDNQGLMRDAQRPAREPTRRAPRGGASRNRPRGARRARHRVRSAGRPARARPARGDRPAARPGRRHGGPAGPAST